MVPDAGGLLTDTVPLTVYWLDALHAEGVAETAKIAQVGATMAQLVDPVDAPVVENSIYPA